MRHYADSRLDQRKIPIGNYGNTFNKGELWKGAVKSALPVTYFGGKSKVAPLVWEAFGDIVNFVEPFFGSGAVLLGRPNVAGIETINDADGLVSNFWRAVQADAQAVAKYADWPVNENDLSARHAWLVGQKDSLQAKLEGDPEFYDPKIAGWWCWGMCCWIGRGFCSGNGPWKVQDGLLVKTDDAGQGVKRALVHLRGGRGVNRKRVHLGNAGHGVNRQLVHLGNAGRGVNRQRVHLGDAGQGVNRKRVHLEGAFGTGSKGVISANEKGNLYTWFEKLSDRLRHVRVCCGDWSRVTSPTVTFKHGMTGVFLDPPYTAEAGRHNELYRVESLDVGHQVRDWAVEQGENPLMRIALCGYEGEYEMPDTWRKMEWKANGGYATRNSENQNAHKERIFFSPACITKRTATTIGLNL